VRAGWRIRPVTFDLLDAEGQLVSPPIYLDFQDIVGGRRQLRQPHTLRDLDRWDLALRPGLRLVFYDDDAADVPGTDDLIGLGTVDEAEPDVWCVRLDPDIRRFSELDRDQARAYSAVRPQVPRDS
jgi:hypothetical protein